jgi:type IV secretory pathway VirD2 relaxase
MRNTSTKPLFKEGEMVRIRINKTFRKGTEPRYSDDVLAVTGVQGQRITLSNGKTLLESELLKVNSAEPLDTNTIDIVNKENRVSRRLKQAGVDAQNITSTKRAPKPNTSQKIFVKAEMISRTRGRDNGRDIFIHFVRSCVINDIQSLGKSWALLDRDL